jgi:bifunctional oligoribonuclease and PAP phosphatase NrnA
MKIIVPEEIITAIDSRSSFLAHIHLGADADAVGSAIALKLGLESIGKVVHLFSEEKLSPEFSFLPGFNSIEKNGLNLALTLPHEAYISLDSAKWSLITGKKNLLRPKQPIINLDHHPDNQIKAKYQWIEPNASSTAEMVYYLLKSLSVEISLDMATAITSGIICDTDAFQNTNTHPETLRLISQFQEMGVNYHLCLTKITRSLRLSELKNWALLLENLKISEDGTFVWTSLSYRDQQTLPIDIRLGIFANAIISRVQDTDFGAILFEKEANVTKGSIRARKPGVDVSQIAHELSGGGHLASASFTLGRNLEQTENEFLRVISRLKAENKL